MADVKVCALEYLGTQSKKHNRCPAYCGPVKIVLVESTIEDYKRKIWGSAIFTFVMILMGATVFTVLLFAMTFRLPFMVSMHIMLCTIGFQLFMTTGIMMFSSLFGGSMYLNVTDRKFQHLILELGAVFFGVVGTVFVLGKMALTIHAITGLLAAFLAVAALVVGLFTFSLQSNVNMGPQAKLAHRYFAVSAFLAGFLCFALGLLKESFVKWAPVDNLNLVLIAFSFLVTVGALATIFMRVKYFL